MRDVPTDIRERAKALWIEALNDGTPDAANLIADALMAEREAHMIDEPIPDDIMKMAIEVLIADATVKERERCAKIALALDSGRGNEKEIAAAIRRPHDPS